MQESLDGLNIYRNPYREARWREAIVEVLDSYASDPMGGGVPLSEGTRATLVDSLEARPWVVTLLAVCNSQPAGLLIALEGFSTFAARPLLNLHDIAVVPRFRGLGIGSRLIEAAVEEARRRGCVKLTLEVLEGNTRAKALYERLGFRAYQLDPLLGEAAFWEKPIQD
jgi:ribosomal protein S18 acetylase RimI-like enzyme